MPTGKALIHGTGLIGASVGLALRGQGWQVAGWDPDPVALEEAHRRGAVNQVHDSPRHGLDQVNLVVLAGPPSAIVETVQAMRTEALVTDIAGVKTPIVEAAGHLPHFVGGHPMAGGATSGPGLASSALFHGATWILTTDNADPEDLESIDEVVRSLGANPVRMTAEEHDRAVARVSHLPHLLAAALLGLAEDNGTALSLAGGGFRDLTRVADSETGWWTEVLSGNAEQVEAAISDLETRLEQWRKSILEGETHTITEILDRARHARRGLGEHHIPVRVVLVDRPGEIARVGHALEASRVDVRDFELRHGEHGGGGILTISVSPRSEEALRQALTAEGFELSP